MGGGEKVVEQFHKLYPEAPIYTSYCADRWRPWLDNKVVTGYLQHWPFSALRRFLPVLRQWWFAQLDLSDFDIIISITGNGEAKFVRTTKDQTHICYCHTPPHFYWAQYNEYLKRPSMRPYWLARLGLRLLVKPLRKRDYAAAQTVDHFIANSTAIQADIKRYYDQDSMVIFPPINLDQFTPLARAAEKHTIPSVPNCIWWGRIVPAKRLDIAIEACNQLNLPLTIIGSGPALDELKKLAGPTISFPGYVSDEERESLIRSADLFIFPANEDFGIAPIEALASGLPVVALKAGGALDYIKDGQNGVFIPEQNTESLVGSLQAVVGKTFKPLTITTSAERFSKDNFKRNIKRLVQSSILKI